MTKRKKTTPVKSPPQDDKRNARIAHAKRRLAAAERVVAMETQIIADLEDKAAAEGE